jgi:hypothetical protein
MCASLQYSENNSNLMDIYWVNMENSTDRKEYMRGVYSFFGLTSNHRHVALTPANVSIPKGFENSTHCKLLPPSETLNEIQRIRELQETGEVGKTVLVAKHCATREDFEPKLLAVTLSHLTAIYRAIHDQTTAHKKYAMIMEDDLGLAFEVDFTELIETAPKDFTILQLVSSNSMAVEYNWDQFIYGGMRWMRRQAADDNWCMGAYIINKERLQPILRRILHRVTDKLMVADIIAIDKCSSPQNERFAALSYCCNNNTQDGSLDNGIISNPNMPQLPCIFAPRGYTSDNYIYNLDFGHSYVSTVPLFLTSAAARNSTLHQTHVDLHDSAFMRVKERINYMLNTDKKRLPRYVNPTCVWN